MIRRTTWILLAILIMGLGVVFYIQKNPVQPANSTPAPTMLPDLLSGWNLDNINRVEYKENGSTSFILELNAGGTWQFVGDTQTIVDQGKVAQLISSFTSQTVITSLAPGTDLATVGLAPKAKVLTLQKKNGEIVTLQIGSLTPTSGGYYVQVNNDAPVVIGKYAIEDMLSLLSPKALAAAAPTPLTPAEPAQTVTP